MPLQTVLIKPASGLCNMRCSYCFYCDEMKNREEASYGMMTEETLRQIIKKVLFQARGQVCFAFQGGEPTLRGLDFYEKAVEYEQRLNRNQVPILNTIQTNGYALDEDWCRFFQREHVLVGVSVDGRQENHDRFRRDAKGGPTYDRIRENIRLLEQYGVEYNILTVVTAQTAENISDIYGEYKRNGWKYQQYIACLDPLGTRRGDREYSLSPEAYGRFLIRLFQLWDKDWKRGKAPYIRQFENYIGILMGYPPEACEQRGVCSVQCVAEADGSAYPCDFYVLDEYRLGNYKESKLEELFSNPVAEDFVEASKEVPVRCRNCPWYLLCRNGCRRHRIQEKEEWINYFCRGYQMFFESCAGRMREIASFLSNQKR